MDRIQPGVFCSIEIGHGRAAPSGNAARQVHGDDRRDILLLGRTHHGNAGFDLANADLSLTTLALIAKGAKSIQES